MRSTLSACKMALSLMAALAAAQATVHASTIYDAAADFSIASNPNGAWSYGYLDITGTTFTPYATSTNAWHSPSATGEIDAWSQFSYDSGAYSVVGKNPTGVVQRENPGGSIFIDPGAAFTHPGNSGEKGTFRLTIPAAGTVDISALFTPADRDSGNRDVHVYINGVDQIPGSFVVGGFAGAHNTISDSQTAVTVTAGTIIDFSVGYGADGVYYNDATQLSASVTFTPAPEPATLGLLTIGGLGFLARRRRA